MGIDKDTINTVIQILNVIGVLGATAFAALSAKYARDGVVLSKKQDDPSVVAYIRQNPSSLHVVEFVVKNEGVRSARNIKFKVVGTNIEIATQKRLKEVELIKNGLALLAGGKEIIQPLSVFLGEQYKKLKRAKSSLVVSYTDSEKGKYQDSFKLDFQGLVDMQIGSPNDEKAVSVKLNIKMCIG